MLTAYGGFLDVFFRTLAARGARIHPPKVVMYMGEALPPERRAWIEETLGARVLSRYCAAEAFKIGYFCEARGPASTCTRTCATSASSGGRQPRGGRRAGRGS